MGKCCIYKIENKQSGKIYIGSTNNFDRRKYQHLYALKNGKHSNIDLQKDHMAYGEPFRFSIIEEIEKRSDLIEREKYFVNKLNAVEKGYNRKIPGEAPRWLRSKASLQRKLKGNRKGFLAIEGCRRRREQLRQMTPLEQSRKEVMERKGAARGYASENGLKFDGLSLDQIEDEIEGHKQSLSTRGMLGLTPFEEIYRRKLTGTEETEIERIPGTWSVYSYSRPDQQKEYKEFTAKTEIPCDIRALNPFACPPLSVRLCLEEAPRFEIILDLTATEFRFLIIEAELNKQISSALDYLSSTNTAYTGAFGLHYIPSTL